MVRNKDALFQSLNRPRCSARVTESLAQTDVSFCQSKMLYILDNVNFCVSMMCISIVVHQFNRMHPWSTWEGMLPGRCSPGKRCHTFWDVNIVLLRVVSGKVHCVPENTLCELYGMKF